MKRTRRRWSREKRKEKNKKAKKESGARPVELPGRIG
jgi:hypothetical protein